MFSTYEISRFLGRKIGLYRFTRGSVAWRFTSADQNVTVGGETFVACRGIENSGIQQTAASTQANQVKISMPYLLDPTAANPPPGQAFGGNFRPYPPSQRVLVTILSMHYGDPDSETNVDWIGRVISPSFTDTTMTLTCDPSYRNSKTGGRVPRIGRTCDVPIYSQGLGMCNLVKATFAVAATLSAVSGLQLTATAFGTATRNLAGGFVEWTEVDGTTTRRTINAHAGSVITVNFGATAIAVGLAVTAYPGCTHDTTGCDGYSNRINYPGFVNLPTADPLTLSQSVG
jgi:hypothetical protein